MEKNRDFIIDEPMENLDESRKKFKADFDKAVINFQKSIEKSGGGFMILLLNDGQRVGGIQGGFGLLRSQVRCNMVAEQMVKDHVTTLGQRIKKINKENEE